MTDRELAGCALSDVLALLEKATPGEWRWSENGNIVTEPYADNCEVGYIYTEHEDDDTEPANSAAICASVNFLRQHGPALLSRTPGGEDARPSENGPFKVIADRGKVHVASDDFTHDAWLHVTGDFGTDEQHREYAEWVARTLNAAMEKERA